MHQSDVELILFFFFLEKKTATVFLILSLFMSFKAFRVRKLVRCSRYTLLNSYSYLETRNAF